MLYLDWVMVINISLVIGLGVYNKYLIRFDIIFDFFFVIYNC